MFETIRETLGRDVPDTETGLALTITAIILALWGLSLLAAEYRWAWTHCDGWRRVLPPTFAYWLGLFIVSDAGLWAVLAVRVLSTPEQGVPFWTVGYFTLSAAAAIVAFWFWSRERGAP